MHASDCGQITGNTEAIRSYPRSLLCRSNLVTTQADYFRIADHPETGEKTSGAVRQLRELRNDWGPP